MDTNSKEYVDRSRSTEMLEARLNINSVFSGGGFSEWQKECFSTKLNRACKILEVGCGTGAQLKLYNQITDGTFSALAIDASADSIFAVNEMGLGDRVEAKVFDMNEIEDLCRTRSLDNTFDFVQSTYALYYATDPLNVFHQMIRCLKAKGIASITVPRAPHGMLEFVSNLCEVPVAVFNILNFGTASLVPEAMVCMYNVTTMSYSTKLRFSKVDDFLRMWESTNYYNPTARTVVIRAMEDHLSKFGEIGFEKNSLMVLGTKKPT